MKADRSRGVHRAGKTARGADVTRTTRKAPATEGARAARQAKTPDAGGQADPPRVVMPAVSRLAVSDPGDAHEREAEQIASRVAAGRQAAAPAPATTGSGAGDQVHRTDGDRIDRDMAPMANPGAQVLRAAATGTEPLASGVERVDPVDRAERVDRATPNPPEGPGPAALAVATPGQGKPMDPGTRRTLESRMGMDLSDVRVHDDDAAHRAAGDVDARAFTHGRDIWLGQGESQRDTRLMAHEAAHIAQQRAGAAGIGRLTEGRRETGRSGSGGGPETASAPEPGPAVLQRASKSAAANASPTAFAVKGKGSIDPGKKITLAKVKVPAWKHKVMTRTKGLDIPRAGTRDSDQVKKWNDEVKEDLDPKTNAELDGSDPIMVGKNRIYVLGYRGGGGYVLGTKGEIRQRIRRPDWDAQGKPHYYDVDHKTELQLGGEDVVTNMWLLDAEANQTAGSNISAEITGQVTEVLAEARKVLGDKLPSSGMEARKTYDITIDEVVKGPDSGGHPEKHWLPEDIAKGKPLAALDVLTPKEVAAAGLIGKKAEQEQQLTVLTRAAGGAAAKVPWDPAAGKPSGPGPWPLFPSFRLKVVTWNGSSGEVTGFAFEDNKWFKNLPVKLPLSKHQALPFAAVVDGRDIESQLRSLELKGMSPVEILVAELREPVGLYVRGRILPTIPLIKDAGLDLVVMGDDVYIEKRFTAADFSFPGPIEITETSLALALGTMGARVTGEIRFAVAKVGEGRLTAAVTATPDGVAFSLVGAFEFDKQLFDEARIELWYRPPKFGGSGTLAVGPKRLQGIKKARVDVTFDDERIEAKGVVEPAIKGVDRGELVAVYDRENGLVVTGTLLLSKDVPGIRSGVLHARVVRRPDGTWALSGDIAAEPDIPGVAASITGSYDDGAFQIEGKAAYAKGMLAGTLTVGATNRALGPDGRPSGPPGAGLTAYGDGEVAITFSPWLRGTIGLKITPAGGVVVSGKVGLPSEFELFPEKKLQRNIFRINLDIPIVGFSVLGQRVGIFATVGGGLDASAGIGPGVLRKAELGVTYDPENEAATTVTGAAELFIRAQAGLRLFVRGGVGAGIPVVSATAGLEVGGALGIEGGLAAAVNVNWSPTAGLTIDSSVSAFAQPVFTFDVTGFVEVTVSYLVGSSTLYDKRWRLAAMTYGSDLRFGLVFPVHYHEGEPFDVALSDIQFVYPEIDTGDLLRALIAQLA